MLASASSPPSPSKTLTVSPRDQPSVPSPWVAGDLASRLSFPTRPSDAAAPYQSPRKWRLLPKTSRRVNSAPGDGGVGDGDKLGSSRGFCACRSPSFPVIQDSVLKGKLGIPEARVNRLMNRSISCTVKNPKVEVFGYPPSSTQAGVAPFNILVGASPPRGLLSSPFPSWIPGGCSRVGSLVVGWWDLLGLGGAPAGFLPCALSPAPLGARG